MNFYPIYCFLFLDKINNLSRYINIEGTFVSDCLLCNREPFQHMARPPQGTRENEKGGSSSTIMNTLQICKLKALNHFSFFFLSFFFYPLKCSAHGHFYIDLGRPADKSKLRQAKDLAFLHKQKYKPSCQSWLPMKKKKTETKQTKKKNKPKAATTKPQTKTKTKFYVKAHKLNVMRRKSYQRIVSIHRCEAEAKLETQLDLK